MRQRGKLAAFARGYGAPRKTEVKRQMSEDGERVDLRSEAQAPLRGTIVARVSAKYVSRMRPPRSSY